MSYSLLKLAREAVETYVKKGSIMDPPHSLPQGLEEKRGVFVTIKKKDELKGCIGTYLPTKENIAHETIYNAVAACSKDYRFPPVTEPELPFLSYEVYIIGKPEKVSDFSELDSKKFGLLVKKGLRSGLLLPGLEGIDSPEKQFKIACRKAGISGSLQSDDVEIFKFKVQKYGEK